MTRPPGTRSGSENTASCSRWATSRRSTFSASWRRTECSGPRWRPAGRRAVTIAPFGFQGALPQQHVEIGFAGRQTAHLEYDGKHFVFGASMGHVFDYKSKTSDEQEATMTVVDSLTATGGGGLADHIVDGPRRLHRRRR